MLFKRYARLSTDNGTTWGANLVVSDVGSPVPPLSPNFDPNIHDCYMGDYDAVAIDSAQAYVQWSDNRNVQSGFQQPDMFFDRIPLSGGTYTPIPTRTPTQTRTPAPPTPTQTPTAGVLYNQYNNAGTHSISSQNFEPESDRYDDELADDFVVPGGQTWYVTQVDVDGAYSGSGPADSVNVRFYANGDLHLPGILVAERLDQTYTGSAGNFAVALSPSVLLMPGTYWVSVQANQNMWPAGQWGWTDRTVQLNYEAAWRNPGGGFTNPCIDWGYRATTCDIVPTSPDQVFLLRGFRSAMYLPVIIMAP
jgi:hypothetical protein